MKPAAVEIMSPFNEFLLNIKKEMNINATNAGTFLPNSVYGN